MEEILNIEAEMLEQAMETKKPVQLIFTNGYQTPAVVVDFDCNVIKAKVKDKTWLVYRHAVSTIVFN